MKRIALAAVILIAVAAAGAWWLFGRERVGSLAQLVPTAPIACPADPEDLSGIEGWAPGAGSAAQTGSSGAQNVGLLGGALGGDASTPTAAPSSTCLGLAPSAIAYFDGVAARTQDIPTIGFDPSTLATNLASTQDAFAFVRDRIQTQIYPGAMRGADGTLQSRGGSPADKALLLATLLRAKGLSVRFVHATLGEGDIAKLTAAAMAARPAALSPDVSAAFAASGIDRSAAQAAAQANRKRVDTASDQLIAAAAAPTQALRNELRRQSINLATNDTAIRAEWANALRDHWWIQANVNGMWEDFDASLAELAPGAHLGATPTDAPLDALPNTAQATLDVSLVATWLGSAQPQILVERQVDLSSVYAQPITVIIGDRSGGSLQIAHAQSFTPSISLAGSEQSGTTFALASGAGNLATLALQIETRVPGSPTRHATRMIVDRRAPDGRTIDPSWTPERTAYALTTTYVMLPVAGEIDPGFAAQREADSLATLRAFMAYVAAGGNGRQMPPPTIAQAYPIAALRYFEYDALVRRRIELQSNGAIRFAFDRPQLAIEHRGFALTGTQVSGVNEFDIVENGMLATGSDPRAAIRANFTRGYIDTLAEQHLFASPQIGGTIALIAQARKDGTPLGLLQVPETTDVAFGPLHTVALAGAQRTGWWQLDPQTGNLIGRMGPNGAGQELAEYAIARANDWGSLFGMLQFYGDFFRCIAGSVESPLSGMGGAQAQKWFTQCAGAAICNYVESLSASEAFARFGSDEAALLYGLLDLSVPGGKNPLPPSGGAACNGIFSSPL